MKKRILALFLVAVLTFSLSACNQTENVPSEVTAETTASETMAVGETTHEITEWTMEEFVTDAELFGYKFSLPCTVNDISPDLKHRDDEFPVKDEAQEKSLLAVHHKNIHQEAFLYVKGLTENYEDFCNSTIDSMLIMRYRDDPFPELNFMGITGESSKDDIIKILGEPNFFQSESDCGYNFENSNMVRFIFDENDLNKMTSFILVYGEEK